MAMHCYLEQANAVLEDAVRGMTFEQMCVTVREGHWTAAEIVEHLSLAFGATAVGMEQRLRSGELDVRPRTVRDRLATLLVVRVGYIPTGRKAPGYTVPCGIGAETALRNLHENLDAMDVAISRLEEKYGDRIIGVHPILGPLRPNQWRKFHLVHTRHHARQILALKAATAHHRATQAAA